jgi:hypothetical protein
MRAKAKAHRADATSRRAKFGCSLTASHRFPARPRGMHRSTYARLKRREARLRKWGGSRPGSGRQKKWTHEQLWHLLFSYELLRRSSPQLRDGQVCAHLAKRYPGLTAKTVRRKLQDARYAKHKRVKNLSGLKNTCRPDSCVKEAVVSLNEMNEAICKIVPAVSLEETKRAFRTFAAGLIATAEATDKMHAVADLIDAAIAAGKKGAAADLVAAAVAAAKMRVIPIWADFK